MSAADDVEFTSLSSVNGSTSSSAQVNNDGDIEFAIQPSSTDETRTFLLEDVTIDAPSVSSDTPHDLTVDVNDTGGADDSNTFGGAIEVLNTGDADNGYLSGRVSDQNNNDVEDANVTATRASDGLEYYTQTNSNGDYTLSVPNGTYDIQVDRAGFTTATAQNNDVTVGETTTANLVIERLIAPGDIEIVSSDSTALADDTDQVEFTVLVTDDNDGSPYEGADVDVSDDGSGITWASNTVTTDANGEATFTATSGDIQTATVTFEVASNTSISTTAEASFTFSGPGDVDGVVRGETADGDSQRLEGADVYAFETSDFESNAVELDDSTNFTGDIAFYRVVDEESGAILDPRRDYRVYTTGQDADDDTPNLAQADERITVVPELNDSDAGVEEGFAVDYTGGNAATPHVVPHEPGNYTIERSTSAPNAMTGSDETDAHFVNESAPAENFTATTYNWQPSQELTAEQAQDLSETINNQSSYDVSFHDETDMFGDYWIHGLSTNGQVGTEYTITTEQAGYANAYAEVVVTEDGLEWENHDSTDFFLNEIPIEPDAVDITQVGTSESADGSYTAFENQTDAHFQQVPRDGATYDVFRVETSAQGTMVNATVNLDFNDSTDLGDYDVVADGTLHSADNDNNTATISTGDDGEAYVWFETNQNDDTVHVEKQATLANDASATDSSNTTFVGVNVFDSASISGIVTNEDNEPLPNSVVWVEDISTDTDGDAEITITPAQPLQGLDRDEIRNADFQINDTVTGDTWTVTGAELEDYDLGADVDRVSHPGVESFTLLTFPSLEDGEAQYTLPRVMATDAPDDGVDYTGIAGYQYDSGESGTGQALNVNTGVTYEGNIVIVGAVPIDVPDDGDENDTNSSDLSQYANDEGVIDATGLGQAAADFNSGEIGPTTLGEVAAAFESGETVA